MSNLLLNLIKPMLNNKQRQLLENGLAQIRQYQQTHAINNRQDILQALQHFGVTPDFLSNTGGLAKNPVVQKIANVCGRSQGLCTPLCKQRRHHRGSLDYGANEELSSHPRRSGRLEPYLFLCGHEHDV